MDMAEVGAVDATGGTNTRGRRFWIRVAAWGAGAALVIAGVLVGGTAYADQRAQSALEGSQTGATDAIASCQADVASSLATLRSAAAAALRAVDVTDRVDTELAAVNNSRDALRNAGEGACSQSVTDERAANDQAATDAAADAAHVADLATQLRAATSKLVDATAPALVDAARENYTAKLAELAKSIDTANTSAASMVGQVADQATLDALNAAITEAKALVTGSTDATDVDGFTAASDALAAERAKITGAATAATASHQAWLDAQAAAAAAGPGGSTSHASSGSSSGGSTGGGSTGGGATGGGTTGGAGVVTWSTCDGTKEDKYIDGNYAGNRGCTTVAYASAAVAPYQNSGGGGCTVVGARISDSTAALVSKASQYTYGRFTFSQENETQVRMTIATCAAS